MAVEASPMDEIVNPALWKEEKCINGSEEKIKIAW